MVAPHEQDIGCFCFRSQPGKERRHSNKQRAKKVRGKREKMTLESGSLEKEPSKISDIFCSNEAEKGEKENKEKGDDSKNRVSVENVENVEKERKRTQ